MITRILVPTDGSEFAMKGVRYAVTAAKKYDAALLGVHIVDIKMLEGPFLRDVAASLGTAPYANYQGNIAKVLEEKGKSALDAFGDLCEQEGVRYDTVLSTGLITHGIVEQAALTDIIIMGRSGEHAEWLEGLIGSTTESVVRRAGRPVLLTACSAPLEGHYVVAYDGSHEAKKALQTAADLAVEWERPLHVLVSGEELAKECLTGAKAYLEGTDVEASYVVREGDPTDVILAYCKETKAALLIMGAYGHSKVHEWVLGSTTTYTINHATCPVLLMR